jgi:tRNA-dihydrouridine synthase B
MINNFSIGGVNLSMPLMLAPMAGVTDFPFREIVRSFGVGLVFSEMIASRAVIESFKNPAIRKRLRLLDSKREKSPIAVQLVGYDPLIMAEAAKFNEQLGADLIDINMGCPVKKVVNTDSGAALMKNEILAGQIIAAVVKAVSIPVTVKCRLGWDAQNLNAVNIAKIAEDSGAKGVALHGRTRSQFYEGKADWDAIAAVKSAIKIPLIGNGDVQTFQDVELLKDMVDAVMIGRGALGKPWLFSQINNYLKTGTVPEPPAPILETIINHLHLIIAEYGEGPGILLARKHLGWYSKCLPGASEFRRLVNNTQTSKDLIQRVTAFFRLG